MSRYPKEKPAIKPAGLTVDEFGAAIRSCKATVYNLEKRGEIVVVRIGSKTLVLTDPREYLESKIGQPGTSGVVARTAAHRARLRARWDARKAEADPPDAA